MCTVISADSSIEITKKDEFVRFGHRGNCRLQVLVELFFDLIRIGDSGSVSTDQSGRRTVIRRSLIPLGGEGSLLTRLDLMANPTPASRRSSCLRPIQKKCSQRALLRVASRVSLRASICTSYLASSLAINADLFSGLSECARSMRLMWIFNADQSKCMQINFHVS